MIFEENCFIKGELLTALYRRQFRGKGCSNGGITQFHYLNLLLFKFLQDLAYPFLLQNKLLLSPEQLRGYIFSPQDTLINI